MDALVRGTVILLALAIFMIGIGFVNSAFHTGGWSSGLAAFSLVAATLLSAACFIRHIFREGGL